MRAVILLIVFAACLPIMAVGFVITILCSNLTIGRSAAHKFINWLAED